MLVSLTVGKVDAGVAVLLTEDKRLIEFPSILLPPDIHSGSIVDINVARNQHAELVAEQKFLALQSDIFDTFGTRSPSAPVLRCRNATQTSVVLEWDPIDLATAELRSLSLFRNGTKAGVIPRDKSSTKISGLALDTEYTFHLVLRTSAGQYTSEKVTVKTHKITDLSGITVTPGILPSQLKQSLAETVQRIGAKMIDTVRIDTTHFVCTEPRGQAWEKAVEMNVPVVVPDWVKGCEREGRMVGVRAYYLDANPKDRPLGPSAVQQQREETNVNTDQQREGPRIEHTPPTPERPHADREESTSATTAGPPHGMETVAEVPSPSSQSELPVREKNEQHRAEAKTTNSEENEEEKEQDDAHKQEESDEGEVDDSRIGEADGTFDEVDL
ncbi:hypothetical protein R9X50_00040400 [Acrodontium crateriforme]|uniref:Chitin biosynthesis protein CHS5 n=1 Tax=Acrodontium crateriforme TaxID=150365 RepID=A0AAQ3LXD7_9PEZI|nr:hypothetical protein R9X50_00040400 [Acrodontium crateriforme]